MRASDDASREGAAPRGLAGLCDCRGFGLVMSLGMLMIVAALAVSIAASLDVSSRQTAGIVDRTAAYYLAEAAIERGIVEALDGVSDWTPLSGDTLLAGVAIDRGTVTLVASAADADQVDLTASAAFRRVRQTVRLQLVRSGGGIRWARLTAPFSEAKEE